MVLETLLPIWNAMGGGGNSILFKTLTLYQIPFLYFLDIYFLYSYRQTQTPFNSNPLILKI